MDQQPSYSFPAVGWSRGEVQSYAIVSDTLEHGKKAVATFLSNVVEDLMEKNPNMKDLHIFSDGAASLFKNRDRDMFPSLKV